MSAMAWRRGLVFAATLSAVWEYPWMTIKGWNSVIHSRPLMSGEGGAPSIWRSFMAVAEKERLTSSRQAYIMEFRARSCEEGCVGFGYDLLRPASLGKLGGLDWMTRIPDLAQIMLRCATQLASGGSLTVRCDSFLPYTRPPPLRHYLLEGRPTRGRELAWKGG
jgi:hypothetical protein